MATKKPPRAHRPSDDRPPPVAARFTQAELDALKKVADEDEMTLGAKVRRIVAAALGIPVDESKARARPPKK